MIKKSIVLWVYLAMAASLGVHAVGDLTLQVPTIWNDLGCSVDGHAEAGMVGTIISE